MCDSALRWTDDLSGGYPCIPLRNPAEDNSVAIDLYWNLKLHIWFFNTTEINRTVRILRGVVTDDQPKDHICNPFSPVCFLTDGCKRPCWSMVIGLSAFSLPASLSWAVITLLMNSCDSYFLKSGIIFEQTNCPPLRCVDQAQPVSYFSRMKLFFLLFSSENDSSRRGGCTESAVVVPERADADQRRLRCSGRGSWTLM